MMPTCLKDADFKAASRPSASTVLAASKKVQRQQIIIKTPVPAASQCKKKRWSSI